MNTSKKKTILGERNSYSKTETDDTFIHTDEGRHMQNGQFKAGYIFNEAPIIKSLPTIQSIKSR